MYTYYTEILKNEEKFLNREDPSDRQRHAWMEGRRGEPIDCGFSVCLAEWKREKKILVSDQENYNQVYLEGPKKNFF